MEGLLGMSLSSGGISGLSLWFVLVVAAAASASLAAGEMTVS